MPPHHEFGWHRARSSLSPGWKHPHPRLRGHPQPPPPPRPPTPCGHHAAVGLGAAEPFKGREPSTNGFHVCGGEWGHREGGGGSVENVALGTGTGNIGDGEWENLGWELGGMETGIGNSGNGGWENPERGLGGRWEWGALGSKHSNGGAGNVPSPTPSPPAQRPQWQRVPKPSNPIGSTTPVSPTP